MPTVMEADTEAALLDTIRTLPAESQRAVLSYAQFLSSQEDARRIEADEAEWDRLFNQPEKMARLAAWADKSLAEHPAEPLDDSRL